MRPALESLLGMIVAASKQGEFKLSSGKISDFYFDGRLVTLDPRGGLLIADELLSFLDGLRGDNTATALGGPAVACIPIVSATVTLLAYRVHDPKIKRTFFVRSETKDHGTKKLVEGPELTATDRVVLVDDTLTSGASLVRASDAVRATGATIVGAWVLLDREEGGRKALMDADIPHIHALFRKTEIFAAMAKPSTPLSTLETIQGAACPKCQCRPVTREVQTRRGQLVAVWRCASSTGKTETCGELAETAISAEFDVVQRTVRSAKSARPAEEKIQ